MQSIESKLDSLLDVYRQVLQKGNTSSLALSPLPLFELPQTPDYSPVFSKDLSSPSPFGHLSSSNFPRGFHLFVSPNDFNLNSTGSPTIEDKSKSASPLQPLTTPTSDLPPVFTPNNISGVHFPRLASPPPPPSLTTRFQLPMFPNQSGQVNNGSTPPQSSPPDHKPPIYLAKSKQDLSLNSENGPSTKEDATWRRNIGVHMETDPLLSSTQDGRDPSAGKCFSVQDLIPEVDGRHSLSASSSQDSSATDNDTGLSGWAEADLFITDGDLENQNQTRITGFSFLGQSTADASFSSDHLRTGAVAPNVGGTKPFSMPHVRLK